MNEINRGISHYDLVWGDQIHRNLTDSKQVLLTKIAIAFLPGLGFLTSFGADGAISRLQSQIYRVPQSIELLKLKNEYRACALFQCCLLATILFCLIVIGVTPAFRLMLSSSPLNTRLLIHRVLGLTLAAGVLGATAFIACGLLGRQIIKNRAAIRWLETNVDERRHGFY